ADGSRRPPKSWYPPTSDSVQPPIYVGEQLHPMTTSSIWPPADGPDPSPPEPAACPFCSRSARHAQIQRPPITSRCLDPAASHNAHDPMLHNAPSHQGSEAHIPNSSSVVLPQAMTDPSDGSEHHVVYWISMPPATQSRRIKQHSSAPASQFLRNYHQRAGIAFA
ncbi:hypothetical protein ACLOJK_019015, partial [Asimina triloba]